MVNDAIRNGVTFAQLFDALNSNEHWIAAQRAVGLQMGVFAFVEPGPPPRHLFYQTGMQAKREGKHFALPFISMESPSVMPLLNEADVHDSKSYRVPAVLCECFHASRTVESATMKAGKQAYPRRADASEHDPRFAHDLFRLYPIAAQWPRTRLSRIELRFPAILAPDGEMSACAAGWMLHRLQDSALLDVLRSGARPAWPPDGAPLALDAIQMAIRERVAINPQLAPLLRPLYDKDSPLNEPIRSHKDWAERLGLVHNGTPTRRMANLLAWIINYGDYLIGNSAYSTSYNPGYFAPQGTVEPEDASVASIYWSLFSHDIYHHLRPFLSETLTAIIGGRFRITSLEQLLTALAQLLLSQCNDLHTFTSRLRFAAAPHSLMRLYEPADRAWLVYPIVRTPDPLDPARLQHAGFFLGTLCEPLDGEPPHGAVRQAPPVADTVPQVIAVTTLIDPIARWLADTFFNAEVHRHAQLGYRRNAGITAMAHPVAHIREDQIVLAKAVVPAAHNDKLRRLQMHIEEACEIFTFAKDVANSTTPQVYETIAELVRGVATKRQWQGIYGLEWIRRVADDPIPPVLQADHEFSTLAAMIVENALKHCSDGTCPSISTDRSHNEWSLLVRNVKGERRSQHSLGLGKGAMTAIAQVRDWLLDLPDSDDLAPGVGEEWVVRLTVPLVEPHEPDRR